MASSLHTLSDALGATHADDDSQIIQPEISSQGRGEEA